MEQHKTIAIIDDDKIFHVLTRRILEKGGVADEILEFYDGQDALTYLKGNLGETSKLPDLIFLDIQMPFMDGWQFLDEYSSLMLTKPVVIYIVSSSISALDHERSRDYENVKGFIIKPFKREKIMEILNELKN
jgi:two-component system, chemotaxis family, chemotaxis protein CheY